MDTRTKIIPIEELALRIDGRSSTWIAGDFDPLLAEHVRRLTPAQEAGRLLIVEVTNPPRPLLAQRARAELVAALSMVDYVVLGDRDGAAARDADITERFIQHVFERHSQESGA